LNPFIARKSNDGSTHAELKILLHTDLAIRPEELFWHRDLGLLTQAFRGLGHEATLVVHPAQPVENHPQHPTPGPVIWASPGDLRRPSWWQDQKPDLVILGLWTRPKYDPIRRAALSATPRVIERADSDGMRTASCGWQLYARRRYDYFRDRLSGWPLATSCMASWLYAAVSTVACPWMEARLAQTMRRIPDLVVETPGAADLWRALVHRLGAGTRIHHIPPPVQADLFRCQESREKEKKIVAVGRWQTHQKNLPLLLTTLQAFLDRHGDWNGWVVGTGLDFPPPHPRIKFVAGLPATQVAEQMKSARILLFTSRYESFLLAGAEALVAGCSVVGPETLVATQQLVKIQGCTSSLTGHLLADLELEQQAWAEGQRDPAQISRTACLAFSPQAVAKAFLSLVE